MNEDTVQRQGKRKYKSSFLSQRVPAADLTALYCAMSPTDGWLSQLQSRHSCLFGNTTDACQAAFCANDHLVPPHPSCRRTRYSAAASTIRRIATAAVSRVELYCKDGYVDVKTNVNVTDAFCLDGRPTSDAAVGGQDV